MSDLAKKLVDRARENGAISDKVQYFSVTDKKSVDLGNGEMADVEVPNGQHRVKIISEKIGKGKGYNGSEQDELQLVVSDNGKQKIWNIALKNAEGKLSYIVEALEPIAIGEEFLVEAFKLKTGKYGKRISKVVSQRTPTVQLNDMEEVLSLDEEISPEEIPF